MVELALQTAGVQDAPEGGLVVVEAAELALPTAGVQDAPPGGLVAEFALPIARDVV